ncbi:MAG: YdjY domain-containing protein, partial [Rhodopirellula sp. JB044]|uniref:YdjY domain-containing protein n=1 Tax=Rhodopirellula sp. JB044 TaxID=3342844 RepID=UPI00370B721D
EDDEYEIDPEILAHIEAQRAALRRIADTYGPPPGAKQLGAQPDLWVDLRAKRVYIDGYVTMTRGPLEMLACPIGTKEHESVIAAFAKSSEVHAALLAIGAQSGTPVRWDPEFLPPTGQTITVWVMWRDPVQNTAPESSRENSEDGQADNSAVAERFIPSEKFSVVDARKWVRNVETQKELSEPWVFAGSSFWTDPEDGTEHYSANAGDMICVSNFSTAMLDVPFNSSADAGNLLFEPFTDRLPVRGTPVRLVLVPQPIPNDDGEPDSEVDTTTPPDASHLPIPAEDQQ